MIIEIYLKYLWVFEINSADDFNDHTLTRKPWVQIIWGVSLQHTHQNFCSLRKVSLQVSYWLVLSIMRYNLNNLFLPLQWRVSMRHTIDTSKHFSINNVLLFYCLSLDINSHLSYYKVRNYWGLNPKPLQLSLYFRHLKCLVILSDSIKTLLLLYCQ